MVKPDARCSPSEDRAAELRRQIEELRRRFPAHSLSPLLMQQLDELEDALQEALAQIERMEKSSLEG